MLTCRGERLSVRECRGRRLALMGEGPQAAAWVCCSPDIIRRTRWAGHVTRGEDEKYCQVSGENL